MTNVQNVVVVDQQRDQQSFGFVAVLILCAVAAFVAEFFWHIVVVLSFAVVLWVLYLLWHEQLLRRQELAVRADEQNRLALGGDPRGVYGDDYEGLEQR